ncbi:hypothetical protein DC498_20610 [Terrimonas sp.]|nr:hypothetical protein DC498_20610 [Terrimonas sp.]
MRFSAADNGKRHTEPEEVNQDWIKEEKSAKYKILYCQSYRYTGYTPGFRIVSSPVKPPFFQLSFYAINSG